MIVIPDVHGRSFWKEAIKGRENEEIIFLGDYLDSYHWEFITEEETLNNFQEILSFKKNHFNNVILLLGNHDLHYFINGLNGGRKIFQHIEEIKETFIKNKELFQLAYEKKINDKLFVFSHAGITKGWMKQNPNLNLPNGEGISFILNSAYESEDRSELEKALCNVSMFRGGMYNNGSSVWADVNEHLIDAQNDKSLNFYQVFGHSQQEKDPIITDNFACLDCRKAFEIDDKGEIKEI